MVLRRLTITLVLALVGTGGLVASLRLGSVSEAHAPHTGLDFSIELDTNGDNVADCGTDAGQEASCAAAVNSRFRAREYLESLGDIPAYRQLQLHFGFYDGVTPASDPDSAWPGCENEWFYFGSYFGHAACSLPGATPSIAYTGFVGSIFYTCQADGAVDLQHGTLPAHTFTSGDGSAQDRHAETEQGFETLLVTCEQPAPYPADSDDDGCPDAKEAASTQTAGGLRNFLSSFDYFNPTGDRMNRVDDILAVVQQYFIDQGTPGYTGLTDRTLYGPNAWNSGPPNGLQRVDDILNIVNQYFHDCV